MQLKCKSCNKLYNLNLKKIGDYLNQKRSLGLCEDCFLNKKWDADYRNNRLRYSDYFNVNLTKIPDIDIFDTDLYFKLNQIIEINRRNKSLLSADSRCSIFRSTSIIYKFDS